MWTDKQDIAFQAIKAALKSPSPLVHYDCSLPLVLSCDTSPYGVGAVLYHVMSDNLEKLIAFASRSLAVTKKNYLQLDKEALGCAIWHNKVPYISVWTQIYNPNGPQTTYTVT